MVLPGSVGCLLNLGVSERLELEGSRVVDMSAGGAKDGCFCDVDEVVAFWLCSRQNDS
jgi:hypothetical protein